ncbi:MAG TPA: hypothetical protein VL625_01910 [Patescibacteria group bacterium]|nr:hypothetical protein [Patescibacteria group bacterium]
MHFFKASIDSNGLTLTPKEVEGFPTAPATLTIAFSEAAKIETILQLGEPDMVLLDINDPSKPGADDSMIVEGLTLADYKARLPGLADVPTFMVSAQIRKFDDPIEIFAPELVPPPALAAALKGKSDILDASDTEGLLNPAIVTKVEDKGLYRDIYFRDRFNTEAACHTKLTVEQLAARGVQVPKGPAPAP